MYFNQSEQCSATVNIDFGLLSKHFCVNDKHDRLVTVYTNCPGPMLKMDPMPRYTGIKTLENLLQNQKANDLVTQFVALGMKAIQRLHRLFFWVDLNLLYSMIKFDS